jgi:signal peptidase I
LILYREFCSFDPQGIYNLSVPEEVNDVENSDEVASSSDSFKAVRDWVIVLVVALVVALGIRTYVLQQFYISGPSMETTLYQPNRVLVNKLSYRLHDVNRGDVVVFDRVTSNGESIQHDDLIKRVIGLPGEKISISKCVVYVNKQVSSRLVLEVKTDVPERGCVFFPGGNRSVEVVEIWYSNF